MKVSALTLMLLSAMFLPNELAAAGSQEEQGYSLARDTVRTENPDRKSVAGKDQFERLYAQAERLRSKASEKGSEWLDTESLLQQSLEEAEKADWETALKLAQKARAQAIQALQQAQIEADAWQHRVVK